MFYANVQGQRVDMEGCHFVGTLCFLMRVQNPWH